MSPSLLLRVFINYTLPSSWPASRLGRVFGSYYARCTGSMVNDAVRPFAAAAIQATLKAA